jgi:hypothetical protein
MTELAQSPAAPVAASHEAALLPTFLGALRGVWLFTWRSQLTWRRLPLGMVMLLILPVLVYLTTASPQKWSQRHSMLGSPLGQLNELSRRLNRAELPLQSEQNVQLAQIFSEEFERAEGEQGETQPPETSVTRQKDQVKACYERIHTRAQSVLDDRQFTLFQSFEKRKLLEAQGRISQPTWNRTGPFYHWLIDFYFFVILPWCCVVACGALIREELQANTLGFLTTRPLTRARLLVLKYFCQTAWLQIIVLIEVLLLFSAGSLRQIPSLSSLLPLFLAAQFLAVPAWCALGAFLGLVTRRYLALALVYGFIVEMGIGRIPTNINTLSLMRHLKRLLAHNAVLEGVYAWPVERAPFAVTALVLAAFVFLSLAALLFTFKEYHHSAEMQK